MGYLTRGGKGLRMFKIIRNHELQGLQKQSGFADDLWVVLAADVKVWVSAKQEKVLFFYAWHAWSKRDEYMREAKKQAGWNSYWSYPIDRKRTLTKSDSTVWFLT
jgi:hypothetical protein